MLVWMVKFWGCKVQYGDYQWNYIVYWNCQNRYCFFFFFYHVCMRVCLCAWVQECYSKCMRIKKPWVSVFWMRSHDQCWVHQASCLWASGVLLPWPPTPPEEHWDYSATVPLYVSSKDLNSGPHPLMTSALSQELPSQPSSSSFWDRVLLWTTPKLVWSSICQVVWPWPHNPPNSASLMMEL